MNKTFDWKDAVYCCSQHAIANEQNVWLKRCCVLLVSKCQWTKCVTEKTLCITGVKMPMNKTCDWKRHCVLLVCKCQWTKCVTENTLCTIGVKIPMNKTCDWKDAVYCCSLHDKENVWLKRHCTAADNMTPKWTHMTEKVTCNAGVSTCKGQQKHWGFGSSYVILNQLLQHGHILGAQSEYDYAIVTSGTFTTYFMLP